MKPNLKSKLDEILKTHRAYGVYIDDSQEQIDLMTDRLSDLGLELYTSTSPTEACQFILDNQARICFVLSDFQMPGLTGFELREKLLEAGCQLPFAIISGAIDKKLALSAVKYKISALIEKPVADAELYQFIIKEGIPRATAIAEDGELLVGFLDESVAMIEAIEGCLLDLETAPNQLELLNTVFGKIHTLKGTSGFFDPKTFHRYCHKYEDFLGRLKKGELEVSSAVVSQLLAGLDVIKRLAGELRSGEHLTTDISSEVQKFERIGVKSDSLADLQIGVKMPNGPTDVARSTVKSNTEIRVPMSLLDQFVMTSGEVTVLRNMINKVQRAVEHNYSSDRDVHLLGELLSELHKVNSTLQNQIGDLRKVSIGSIVKPLYRTVRDVSRQLKKQVNLIVDGDALLVEMAIADVLTHSFIHLIRNSADHGIESPEERVAAGKPAIGTIKIQARPHGEMIQVVIEDDGKGISPEVIRKKLISSGRYTESQLASWSSEALIHMIFDPGFSTAAQVTDISGRGVGLSAVEESARALGGKIETQSICGKGSRFVITLPIPKSTLIAQCLTVQCGEYLFGIPQDNVVRVIQANEANFHDLIQFLEGSTFLRLSGKVVPLVSARALINKRELPLDPKGEVNIVVLKTSDRTVYGLIVDKIEDSEDAVVKGLSNSLKSLEIFKGATFQADGTVGLILDPDGVAKVRKLTHQSTERNDRHEREKDREFEDFKPIILFDIDGPEVFAISQSDVLRLEEINFKQIQVVGNQALMAYRGKTIPIIDLATELGLPAILKPSSIGQAAGQAMILVVEHPGLRARSDSSGDIYSNLVGVLIKSVVDTTDCDMKVHQLIQKRVGVKGSLLLKDRTVTLVSLNELFLNESVMVEEVTGSTSDLAERKFAA